LQLDINLLTSAFASTLAEAVRRTAVQNVSLFDAGAGMLARRRGRTAVSHSYQSSGNAALLDSSSSLR
jgi:hypothetical protein